ncbi:hypothetical protein [Nocardioides sp. URHA0020]|uniref:hypothetical protein n=1 Tax=Nocardioides sp. URHA0020 TaxID=1380392 RepID=UPI000491A36D|nr:hypothetical protein [Nocardioides sp. URHA0020]
MLPRFTEVSRRRPVDLVVPGSTIDEVIAPYAALAGPGSLALESGSDRLVARYDGSRVWVEVTTGGRTTRHRSRRHGRPGAPVDEVGLVLTGTHVTALTRHDGSWVARARVDLQHRIDTRDETWLDRLAGDAPTAGRFGQLGLRDIRVASHADGTPYRIGERVVLTATSAGPGFFDTAHTSVWALDPTRLELEHLSDVFFRRPDAPGAYGDHATHLVRDGDRWLVATSTWGDFDRSRPGASVAVTLAETTADLLTGRHLLDTRVLPLPTEELRSVAVWDPHLVRTDDGWLVGFVSSPGFWNFHPALASGPSLDALALRATTTDRTATEGTTLLRLDDEWRVLASDGRDSRRRLRRRYPVFDLDLRETGTVAAPYPTNIPWPTLVPDGDSWLLVAFDGTPYGGRVPGYGTHGDVVFMRPEPRTTV